MRFWMLILIGSNLAHQAGAHEEQLALDGLLGQAEHGCQRPAVGPELGAVALDRPLQVLARDVARGAARDLRGCADRSESTSQTRGSAARDLSGCAARNRSTDQARDPAARAGRAAGQEFLLGYRPPKAGYRPRADPARQGDVQDQRARGG